MLSQTEINKINRRVVTRQVGGDDGYQYALIVDGRILFNGMTRNEACWRRDKKRRELCEARLAELEQA